MAWSTESDQRRQCRFGVEPTVVDTELGERRDQMHMQTGIERRIVFGLREPTASADFPIGFESLCTERRPVWLSE